MASQFVQNLHALLQQSISNDTVALKAATATLSKDFYKNPECIPGLTSILQSSPDQAIRQLAAVELRKRVSYKNGELWTQVPQNDREGIKSLLPNQAVQDPANIVRHSIARVISAIASLELPLNNWNELLPFLSTSCTSNQVNARATGIYILFTILENSTEGFLDHLNSIYKLCGDLLNDPESLEVQVTAVRTLGTLAQYIELDEKDQIRTFQGLIPNIFGVIGRAVEANNEEYSRHCFDIVETLLILETPLLGKHIPDLVQFTLRVGANSNVDPDIQIMGLNALNWTVQYKKTRIQSQNLAGAILEGLMPIGTGPEPEDVDDEVPSRTALRIIDTLATSLPPSQVFPVLRNLILQYMQNPDANYRRCAMMALGVSIEGCSEFMTPHMSQVWPVVEAGLSDSDPNVKKATCSTIGCICEWLEDECIARHAVLIPAVLSMIDHQVTQAAACTALDALLEILGSVIEQYLDPIMNKLIALLDTVPIKTKAVITGAIGSAAHAAKDKFNPYFQPTLQKLEPFLHLTGEGEETELRGITVDAIGTFAEAVGKDAFAPFFPSMMEQAFLGIKTDSARLKECSFLFFGVMAKVFGKDFAPYLANAVPALLTSLKQNEHADPEIELHASTSDFASGTGESPADAISVTDKEQQLLEDLDVDKLLEVNSSIAVEKEIAADTFGSLFEHTKEHFLPYLEESTMELNNMLEHYYEGIRKSAVESLLQYIRTFYELSASQEWEAGAKIVVPLDEKVKKLINLILPALLNMYETEDDKKVAASVCLGIAETLTTVGPAFIEGHLEEIGTIVSDILEGKAVCQQDPDQDDEDSDVPEDQAEYDSVLTSSAGDVVSAMASTLGADFQQALTTFLPMIMKFYTPKRSLSDRSSAVGTVAEIISGMKGAITPFTEQILQFVFQALGDEDPEVYSNASFAAGLIVENSDIDLSGQYLNILAALQPHFNVSAEAPPAKFNARDNAAGAVGRLLLKNTNAVPLDQLLPVFFGILPLKNDMLENGPVFRAIFHLFRSQPAAVMPFLDQLLGIFAQVLDPSTEQLSDEVRAELIQLVGALNQENPQKVEAAGLRPYL